MGIHDYFFETKISSALANLKQSNRRLSATNKFDKRISYFNFVIAILILVNLFLLALVFVFSPLKKEIETLNYFQSSDRFKSLLNSNIILKYKPILLNLLEKIQLSAQMSILNLVNYWFDVELTRFSSIKNKNSPFISFSLTLLCLMNLFNHRKNVITHFTLLMNGLLTIINFEFFSNYFKSIVHFFFYTDNIVTSKTSMIFNDAENLYLKYGFVFIPLLMIFLLLEFVILFKDVSFSKVQRFKDKPMSDHNNNNATTGPNNTPHNLQSCNNQNKVQLSLKKSSNPEKSYTLMKYLDSSDGTNTNVPSNQRVFCSPSTIQKVKFNSPNVIKPARLSHSAMYGGSTSGKCTK